MPKSLEKFKKRLFFLLILALTLSKANAAPKVQFSPPPDIEVNMYWLQWPSGAKLEPATLCYSGDTAWGCTAFDGAHSYGYADSVVRPYPYSTVNPVTVDIETNYLKEVLPQEIIVSTSEPATLQAQAVASRSYAYWHIEEQSTINNSNQLQVFIPYRFEFLRVEEGDTGYVPSHPPPSCSGTSGYQRDVCDATTSTQGVYVSYPEGGDEKYPAFTEFSPYHEGDWTVAGSKPYLQSIYDPIPAPEPGSWHGRGMSQNHAEEWAEGEQVSSGYPQWEHYEQILVHYYTGVHLRDGSGNLLTPTDRWNPIVVDFGATGADPPQMQFGNSYPVDIIAQNTGTGAWNSTSYCLSYYWEGPGGTYEGTSQVCLGSGEGVPPGEAHPFNALSITPPSGAPDGAYRLRIDMKDGSGFFSRRQSGLSWYALKYPGQCINACNVFLPKIMKGYAPPRNVWIYDGSIRKARVSHDNGLTWQNPVSLNGYPAVAIAAHPAERSIAWYLTIDIGVEGMVWKTTDGGLSFTLMDAFDPGNETVTDIFVDPVDTNRVYVLAHQNNVGKIYKSSDGGVNWDSGTVITPTTSPTLTIPLKKTARGNVHPQNSEVIIVGGEGSDCDDQYQSDANIWRSTDGGANWTKEWCTKARFARISSVVAFPIDGSIWYASVRGGGTDQNGIVKSTDRGETWTRHPITGLTGDVIVEDIAVDSRDRDLVLALVSAGGDSGVYRSTDGGVNWTLVKSCSPSNSWRLRADPAVSETFWLVGISVGDAGGGGLFTSTDGGVSWTRLYTSWLTGCLDLN